MHYMASPWPSNVVAHMCQQEHCVHAVSEMEPIPQFPRFGAVCTWAPWPLNQLVDQPVY